MSVRDLIIIGGGPSGLSAAIAAKRRGLDAVVVEQGSLVHSIARFPPQMVFFTTPELLEIGGLPFVSPYDKPTKPEALRYYRRVVEAFDVPVSLHERVLAVERDDEPGVVAEGRDGQPLSVFAVTSETSTGAQRVRRSTHVVFAIGYFDRPNQLGVPGEGLPHVDHYYGDPHGAFRQRVVVVGGGNSAAEAALELYRAGAHVTLVHRGPELKSTIKYWVRPDIENRIKEGAIAVRWSARVREITRQRVMLDTVDGTDELPAERVLLLTGYRADTGLMTAAGVALTDREGPRYDPATFETNVPGLFVAGGALAGIDTGTVFIENGRLHGEKIVDAIAARLGR